MSATVTADARTLPLETTGVETGKLGMWIFLASEIMFFTAFIGGYVVLRLGSEGWPDPNTILAVPVLALNTFILICSSVTMVKGLQAIQRDDRKGLILNLCLTMALGLLFLIIKIADYAHMVHNGFTISSSLFGACYYTLTGFHGLHVLGGVVSIAVMTAAAAKGKFSSRHYVGVENVGLYWHFVDLVWIVLFAILCLV